MESRRISVDDVAVIEMIVEFPDRIVAQLPLCFIISLPAHLIALDK
jgi:hypothetical protein